MRRRYPYLFQKVSLVAVPMRVVELRHNKLVVVVLSVVTLVPVLARLVLSSKSSYSNKRMRKLHPWNKPCIGLPWRVIGLPKLMCEEQPILLLLPDKSPRKTTTSPTIECTLLLDYRKPLLLRMCLHQHETLQFLAAVVVVPARKLLLLDEFDTIRFTLRVDQPTTVAHWMIKVVPMDLDVLDLQVENYTSGFSNKVPWRKEPCIPKLAKWYVKFIKLL
jgi:hypothetical protein